MIRPVRSYLYVPGDRADRLLGARARGADALIVDLEDAVAPARKAEARALVADWLTPEPGPQIWVRINAESVAQDVAAVARPGLDGIVVPKADPELLAEVDARLTAEGSDAALLPLIESAAGLLRVAEVAAAPRVLRLGIGEADLIADLGLRPGPDRAELAPVRLQVVVASAAVGIARPLGATSTDFRDLDAFCESAHTLARQGFRGRTAIHPAQVPVIHDVFTPTDDEVATAQDIVARFDEAGGGGAVDAKGRFLDAAVVRSAREVLSLASPT
ncbi:HpcH/HpaI aldolase/citrate lyase family protein [Cryptosporangium sp. NPDC048952]|uniref:HpcH/HpaI aldolase/citrate lyase family protein n=1 Tax=Cryptosporangium sp. NPDC048952 TaxID=3363961 RepID=UPI00371BC750